MGIADIRFAGLAAPVRTVDCEAMIDGLAGYIPRWSFTVHPMTPADYGPEEPCAVVAHNGTAWLVQSPHTDAPRVHKTETNAVCDVLSILASALIAQDPDLLCFHAAAVDTGQGLVLFPALRRSGKSTLTAVLMARGMRAFTDDYLPVTRDGAGDLLGHATGIAARLRQPLPDGFPDAARSYLDTHKGPENSQYRYLGGPAVAPHGQRAKIRAVVFLDRQDNGPAELAPVPMGVALARLAKQNFSRGMPAGDTLSALIHLVQTVPTVRLRYSDLDAAADLVTADLGTPSPAPPQPVTFPTPAPAPDSAPFDPDHPYRTTEFAKLQEAGDVWVGASHDGVRILQFDATAVAVIDLLRAPMTPRKAARLIHDAVPDSDPAQITETTFKILRTLLKAGYIARHAA